MFVDVDGEGEMAGMSGIRAMKRNVLEEGESNLG
jgi:hypothetical protein